MMFGRAALHIAAAVLSQNDDDFVANVFCEATALRITVASSVKKLTIFLRGDIVSPVGVFRSFAVVAADIVKPCAKFIVATIAACYPFVATSRIQAVATMEKLS